jgi:hypothetical protein
MELMIILGVAAVAAVMYSRSKKAVKPVGGASDIPPVPGGPPK